MCDGYEFYRNIYELHILLNQYLDIVGRKTCLMPYGQYYILHCIAEQKNGPIDQRKLDDIICVRASTISQHLRVLCKKGYITHCSPPDNLRCKEVALTESGRKILRQMDDAFEEEIAHVFFDKEILQCNEMLKPLREKLIVEKEVKA